jgi:hypothetical protein
MMVSTYCHDDSQLLLVLQTDHSRIAGLLAAHWGNDEFEKLKPYTSMVLAAQEHDSGWWYWEIKPNVNEEGFPSDYIGSIKHLGDGVWLELYRQGIAQVAARDLYAAYLTSMHGEGLLTRGMGLLPKMPDYSADSATQSFIAEQRQLRPRWLQELQKIKSFEAMISESHLWTNFKLMEVFDQFAQFLCNRYPLNSQARTNGPTNTLSNLPVPIGSGRPDVNVIIHVQNDKEAVVDPFPFDLSPLKVSFQGRLIPKRRYLDQEDFLEQFYRAERLNIGYELHRR